MFVYASRKIHALLRQIYVRYTLALHNYKLHVRKIYVNKESLPTKIKPRIRCDRQRMYHNIQKNIYKFYKCKFNVVFV